MASWDAICVLTARVAREGIATVKKMLDLRNITDTGCWVKKRPDCCELCRRNNDCSRIPMHVRCHCIAVPYLSIDE